MEVTMEENNSSSVSDIAEESKDFDFEEFCGNIKKCILGNEEVELETYLQAYEQLYSFFILLGGAFQFVASDVKSKIKILQKFQQDEVQEKKKLETFLTVNAMVNYEKHNDLLEKPKYVSGCRTFLRLHRGLDFIRKFLEELYNLEDNVKLGSVARDIYDKTLADYHTWIVRSAARVAMQFLPSRGELLRKISKNDEGKLKVIMEKFPIALQDVNTVYDRSQKTFSDNKILNLP